MPKKLMGFNDEPGGGKDVKDTSMLDHNVSEKYQTGTNPLKRYKSSHPRFGKLGARGLPD